MTQVVARAALEAALARLSEQGEEALAAGTYNEVVKAARLCTSKAEAYKLCREHLGCVPREIV